MVRTYINFFIFQYFICWVSCMKLYNIFKKQFNNFNEINWRLLFCCDGPVEGLLWPFYNTGQIKLNTNQKSSKIITDSNNWIFKEQYLQIILITITRMRPKQIIFDNEKNISKGADVIVGSHQIRDLGKLYAFVQSIQHLSDRQISNQHLFEDKNLTQIALILTKFLNQDQVIYDKCYIGAFCIFIEISNRPIYYRNTRNLKSSFFKNLVPIMLDILNFWQQNKNSQNYSVARVRLLAFLNGLSQIQKYRTSYFKKIFTQQMIQLIAKFEPCNDQSILKNYSRIILQCSTLASKKQKIKFSQTLFKSLKYQSFPIRQLNFTLGFISDQLPLLYLCNHEWKIGVVGNLRELLKICIQNQQEGVNLTYLSEFIDRLSQNSTKNIFSIQQIIELSGRVKKFEISRNLLQCLKRLASQADIFNQLEVLSIFANFYKKNETIKDGPLEILSTIVRKLNGNALIQMASSKLFQRIQKIITDDQQRKQRRILALNVFKGVLRQMGSVNTLIYQQLQMKMRSLEGKQKIEQFPAAQLQLQQHKIDLRILSQMGNNLQ